MLNLPIAMLKAFFSLIIIFQELTLAITVPLAGETLRGQVEIQGRMDIPNIASAELAFTFSESASDPAATWFTIQTFPQPTLDSALAVWDTTTVTDGDYDLRLRVYLLDGSFQDVIVSGVKIRNYTPDPTAVPSETPTDLPSFSQFNSNPVPSSSSEEAPSVIRFPTSTPLPSNPASLETDVILTTFGKSAFILLAIFIFIALLLRLRRNS